MLCYAMLCYAMHGAIKQSHTEVLDDDTKGVR